jgi:ribosomal protein S18 acetylase RimI-like enzyme
LYTLPEPLRLREAAESDEEFLAALYFSSREDLHQIPADGAMLAQLIATQRTMQQTGFRRNYPDATYWILEQECRPIGRVVVDATPPELRLVDLAIVPQARRMGAAKAVLHSLQEAAFAQGLTMSLGVAKSNEAARTLYRSMGFTLQSEDAVFEQLAWREHAA